MGKIVRLTESELKHIINNKIMETKEQEILRRELSETLREQFKRETRKRLIVEDGMGNSFFTEEYVEWLEKEISNLRLSDNNI